MNPAMSSLTHARIIVWILYAHELAYLTIPSYSRDFIADWAYKEVSYKICPYSSLDVYQPVLVYTQSRCDVHYGHVNNIFTSGS